MKNSKIYLLLLLLLLNASLGCMDTDPLDEQINSLTFKEQVTYQESSLSNDLINLINSSWNHDSAEKINNLMKRIDEADPQKENITFGHLGSDLLRKVIQNHLMHSSYEINTDLCQWIAWFAGRNAQVDTLDSNGHTPLTIAIAEQRPDVVKALLDLGAKPTTVNKEKSASRLFTPLEYAHHKKGQSYNPLIGEIIQLLEKKQALLLAQQASSSTATKRPLTRQALDHLIMLINNTKLESLPQLLEDYRGVNLNQYVLINEGLYVNPLLHVLRFEPASRLIYAQMLLDLGGTDLNEPMTLQERKTSLLDELNKTELQNKNEVLKWLYDNGLQQPGTAANTTGTGAAVPTEKISLDDVVAHINQDLQQPSPLITQSSTTDQPITQPTPQTTTRWKFLNRSQALWTTLVTAVTVSAVYTWFTAAYPTTAEDALINNTGKPLFVSLNNDPFIAVKPGTSLALLNTGGTLEIKLDTKQATSDLTLDLSDYESAAHDNEHLNLIISKNWLSWLFGPLRASARWVVKKD